MSRFAVIIADNTVVNVIASMEEPPFWTLPYQPTDADGNPVGDLQPTTPVPDTDPRTHKTAVTANHKAFIPGYKKEESLPSLGGFLFLRHIEILYRSRVHPRGDRVRIIYSRLNGRRIRARDVDRRYRLYRVGRPRRLLFFVIQVFLELGHGKQVLYLAYLGRFLARAPFLRINCGHSAA